MSDKLRLMPFEHIKSQLTKKDQRKVFQAVFGPMLDALGREDETGEPDHE